MQRGHRQRGGNRDSDWGEGGAETPHSCRSEPDLCRCSASHPWVSAPPGSQKDTRGKEWGYPTSSAPETGGGGGEDAAPRGSCSVPPPQTHRDGAGSPPGATGGSLGGGGGVKPHPPPAEPPPPGAPDSDFGLSSLGQSPSFARCQNGHGSVCTASWSPGNVINRGVIPAAARFGSVSPSAFGITNFGAVNGAGRPRSPPCRGAADPEPLQVAGPGPGPGRGRCPGDGSLREMAARPLRPPYREPTPYDSTSP